ncbi:MAG: TPM domain-containing protein [Verrucomicrobiota bacterium]
MRRFYVILVWLAGFRLLAGEVIPPVPPAYFNDYAKAVSPGTAAQLNQALENFERQTSDQIVVAVYPKLQSDSDVADYCVRVFRAWGVGQKDKNNGAVLFVFVQDHKLFLQTGYGLEGVLPDALCKRIIDEQITPRFKAGDYDGGLTAGVAAILAAVKGEYHGTGTTVAERHHQDSVVPVVIFVVVMILIIIARARSYRYGGIQYWGGGWSGGGSSGGWSSGGGGGGGFSGGGGSSGGGGAGGSW